MSAIAAERLPGISFEVVPPQVPDSLPRMDVAGFVGFAQAGPLHVPVAVEDVERFREVFGADVELGRDPRSGAPVHAHLGPAVDDFFRNGGQRCWVVRVAADSAARSEFPLAGLVRAGESHWQLASACCRAVGSWADRLRVAPAQELLLLPSVVAVDRDHHVLRLAADAPLVAGDLVRLTLGPGVEALVTVQGTRRRGRGLDVVWDRVQVLRRPSTELPPVERAAALTTSGEEPLSGLPSVTVTPAGRVQLVLVGDERSAPGALVRLDLAGGSLLAVAVRGDAHPVTSGTQRAMALPDCEAWLVEPPGVQLPDPEPGAPALPVAERITLSLAVWSGERLHSRLDGLGLDPRHPRYWADLPTDEQLYRRLGGGADGTGFPEAGPGLPPLWSAAAAPRLAVAGPARDVVGGRSDDAEEQRPPVWLPLAVPDAVTPAPGRGPVGDGRAGSRLSRDGLAEFGAGLFLDRGLVEATAGTLVDRAIALTSLDRLARPLRGVHALLPVDEVTLVAVPDAVHPGWHPVVERSDEPVPAPRLWLAQEPGKATAWWSTVRDAASYVVERASRADMASARVVLDGPAPLGPMDAPVVGIGPLPTTGPVVGVVLPPADCPGTVALRVRARTADGRTSPWSNTVVAVLPPVVFDRCAPRPAVPDLVATASGTDPQERRLQWRDEPGLLVEVETSRDPLFPPLLARTVPAAAGGHLVRLPERGVDFYRARLRDPQSGEVGGWSATLVLAAPARAVLQLVEPSPESVSDDLLAVHRALLRLAGARGDLLAVLSLAQHYRSREAVAHLSALTGLSGESTDRAAGRPPAEPPEAATAGVHVLGAGEQHVLSHGVVYHPWPVVRTPTGTRPTPPDGCASGVIARRSIARGAWASPGNQLMDAVVALTPQLDAPSVAALLRCGVNVLGHRPVGPVALTARTLSLDPELEPIGVRRLLVLLRRVALRYGTTYVFEPHDERFRTMVRRLFEGLLGELHRRGAFAGTQPGEAFRVVTDGALNAETSTAAGRFVVELRVAPARPLEFLRVRLVQAGSGQLQTREG